MTFEESLKKYNYDKYDILCEYLDNYYGETVYSTLTPDDKKIIKTYSAVGYYEMYRKCSFNLNQLERIVKKCRTPFPLKVYRGTNCYRFHSTSKIYGDVLTNNIPYSTSVNPKVANMFKNGYGRPLVVEINLPVDYPALWIRKYALVKEEAEFIINKNSQFKILSADYKQSDDLGKYRLFRLEPIMKK